MAVKRGQRRKRTSCRNENAWIMKQTNR